MNYIKHLKGLSLSILTAVIIFIGCQAAVEDLTGPSALGNTLGIQGLFGGAGIQNDGASQATIRVEVFTTQNIPTVGATVTLTTTLGTLGSASLTTDASGTATTTLTSGTVTGMAFITATVDNVSATTAVPII
ncbi:MAG: Ig-like domain-containing protein [Nitrospinae bacterium]|nr:Ig-like domain-containing protein [Nitrospinota bacterium]